MSPVWKPWNTRSSPALSPRLPCWFMPVAGAVRLRPDSPTRPQRADQGLLTRRNSQMKVIKNFLRDESGMETLEYAVIAGLIAAVAVLVYASGWGATLVTRITNASTTG